MESSPSKRRKTSPTTSVPIDAPTTPSRIPIPKNGARTLPDRPSFASPTKASIARHNPQLLNRPSSSGTGAERSGSRGRNLDDVFARALQKVRPSIEGRDAISGDEGAGSLGSTTQENEDPQEDRKTPVAVQSSARRSLSVGGGLTAKPRRMSRSPAKQMPKSFGSTTADATAGGELQENFNPFRRAGLRRSPVASQEVQVPEEDINPFQKRGLRRSPIASQPLQTIEQTNDQGAAEPAVSTTPTAPLEPRPVTPNGPLPQGEEEAPPEQPQQSPVLQDAESGNAVPQGPLNVPASDSQNLQASTPTSRRLLNEPEEPELPPTPTQLGILDPVVTTPPAGIHDTPSKRARKSRSFGKKLKSSPLKPREPPPESEPVKDVEPEAQKEPLHEKPKRRRSARFSIPEDPHADKKKSRDELLKELRQVQADIALASQENERLRLHYESKRSTPVAPSNPDELLAVLARSTAPEPASEPKQESKSIFQSIGSFLPFSSRRKRSSIRLPVPDRPIPSHLPVAVDDPLPYLQAFSPLRYTSNITLLPSDPTASDSSPQEAQPILQRHLITASHPSGLFTARLSMTVDSSLLTISSIDIEKLPSCAEKELGTFMREHSSPEGALPKDIGLICWAMGRWVEVSVLRARFWCAVEHEFGTAEARAQSLQRKKKRKRQQTVTEDEDAVPLEGHDDEGGAARKQKWTRRHLLPQMGRTAMELATDDVILRLEWRIGFDWTGEVDSFISASARLPKSCRFSCLVFSLSHLDSY